MANSSVRVRFAPSPTGPLHIGGVRTALFNYLFAKKNNGTFILRIEDTDQTRFVEGAEQYIVESLKWCGIQVDEGVEQGGDYGPYRQSDRKAMYKDYADKLLAGGHAYIAFDTPEELDELRAKAEADKQTFTYNYQIRNQLNTSLCLSEKEVKQRISNGEPYVVRYKMPENEEIHMKDIIRGDIKVNTSTLDDKVLFKSDGMPTYHLANIVDDHLMQISHVIRGEEWLPSMPLHVMLYRSFGWEDTMPQFAHLPLLLKPTGKGKLSKRDGDKMGFPVFPLFWPYGETARGYREDGYYSEAFINMLALLGWNPGTEQEIFSLEELTSQFSLERVNKSGARFDPEKAKWFNHQYLQKRDDKILASEYNPILKEKGVSVDSDKLEKIVGLVKERVDFVSELWEQTSFFFEAPTDFDSKVIKKRWKEDIPEIMLHVTEIMKSTESWTATELGEKIKGHISENELNMGQVMNSIRLCLVGGAKGPDLMLIAELLGKEETIKRIEFGVNNIKR